MFRVQSMEARDLWNTSKQTMQANRQSRVNKDNPETIATYVATSTATVPDHIPTNTFKGGMYPHTFTTMNFEDNAEPDTQKLVQNMSPLEFASLGKMLHVLPKKLNDDMKMWKPRTDAQGVDMAVTGRRKWRTSDAQKKRPVRFNPYTRTSTNIPMFGAAQGNAAGNKGILKDQQSKFATQQQMMNPDKDPRSTFLNRENATRFKNIGVRLASGVIAGKTQKQLIMDALASEDAQALMNQGWTRTGLYDQLYQGLANQAARKAAEKILP